MKLQRWMNKPEWWREADGWVFVWNIYYACLIVSCYGWPKLYVTFILALWRPLRLWIDWSRSQGFVRTPM